MSGCERNYDFGDLITFATCLNRLESLEYGKEGFQLGGKHAKQNTIWGKMHPMPPGVDEPNLACFTWLETYVDNVEDLKTCMKKERRIFARSRAKAHTVPEVEEKKLEDGGASLFTNLWEVAISTNVLEGPIMLYYIPYYSYHAVYCPLLSRTDTLML
ncbi:hypothetical protein R1sor_015173 [Riccia sorocarpa]|uniref:Uncharacterized protein n=1 Tax=Riccia sorocarpa TaxID=122646 RepID=A0ABD3HHQ6_9MARC